MLSKVKLTGVVLGVLASACLATHRANLRRRGSERRGDERRELKDEFPGKDAQKLQQVETRADAGGLAL